MISSSFFPYSGLHQISPSLFKLFRIAPRGIGFRQDAKHLARLVEHRQFVGFGLVEDAHRLLDRHRRCEPGVLGDRQSANRSGLSGSA